MSPKRTLPEASAEDRHGEGVPFGKDLTLCDGLPFAELQASPVNNTVTLPFTAGFIDHGNLSITVHNDPVAIAVVRRCQVDELQRTFCTCLESRLLCLARCSTTDMEGPHGQLGSRLTDRLGSNDTDCFAKVDDMAAGQIASVA